jgi:transposase
MKGFHLTKDQLQELKLAHRLERNRSGSRAYKINAIILLGTGWKLKQVKEALLLNDETLRHYVKNYREGDIEKLVEVNHKGRQERLEQKQKEQLNNQLDENIYLTTASVIDYVKRKYNVTYSPSGMRDLLHRLGYVYKKPKLVPGNPDREAQELFIEQYEAFMLEKPEDIEVLFVDAVHPEHNAMASYGWIKRGKKKEIRTNSGRDRLNLHGALNAETLEVTILESLTINSDSTLELIEVLDQKYPLSKEIIMIMDNARYHYSKVVQEKLLEHPRVRFVFLPSYSPNLNLIERLWKFFKKKVLYNKYHESLSAFRIASIDFFKNIDRYSSEIASLMSGGFEMNYT